MKSQNLNNGADLEHGKAYVKRLFDKLAPIYDRGNTLISFGLHLKWKRDSLSFAAEMLNVKPVKVIDGCCGTGDYSFLSSEVFSDCIVTGIDLSEPMLEAAKRRAKKFGSNQPDFVLGDLTDLSAFYGYDCDLFTIGFGLRNIPERNKALREIRRVTKIGGGILILDLAKPVPWYARPLMFMYLRVVMPLFSLVYTGKSADYLWLARSLESFPDFESLVAELESAGFGNAAVKHYGFGMVAAVRAVVVKERVKGEENG